MEKEHVKRIQKMSEDDFRALLDDLVDNSRPLQEKSDFSQELRQSRISTNLYDEPSTTTKNTNSKRLNNSNSNNRKISNKSVSSADDCSSATNSKKSAKSTKSMHDLRENDENIKQQLSSGMKGSSVKSIPDLKDNQHRFHFKSDCFEVSIMRQVPSTVGENLSTHSGGLGDNFDASYVDNQLDESDPSAGINFFPAQQISPITSSSRKQASSQKVNSSDSSHPACCSSVNSSQQSNSYLKSSNNNSSLFSGRDSLRNLERCVERIDITGAPIYDSVCHFNRSSINNHSNTNTSHRNNRDTDGDSCDKMEFGESHNFEHKSQIIEFRRNYSPVNKDTKDCNVIPLLPTPKDPESSTLRDSEGLKKRTKRRKTQESLKKAEEIPGHVGHIEDLNLLESWIRGEKDKHEIRALERAQTTSTCSGDKARNNGTSPENAQETKKNKKKLKKKLNRDNRSVSEKNLPVNKQNGNARTAKSSSKPVSSNEASSSEVDEPEQSTSPSLSQVPLPSSGLKSQSLFLAEYEFANPVQASEDVEEFQTVSDPEVEREVEFVTPKGKAFKKSKKAPPKVINDSTVFDSRRGFSKRDLKRDVHSNNGALHNGYESERDVHNFVPEVLNLPLKISTRNVIAPTSRVLPIVIDDSDVLSSGKTLRKSSCSDGDSQIHQGNIVNGYFPRINNDFIVMDTQAASSTGTLSYAQIAKNIAAAAAAAAANSANSNSNSVSTSKPHKPEKEVVPQKSNSSVETSTVSTLQSQSVLTEEKAPRTSLESKVKVPQSIPESHDVEQLDNANMLSSQPLRVISTGDNCFTVETVCLQDHSPAKESDSQRFMFGNFDNEEIDSVLSGANFSPLDDAYFIPTNLPKFLENSLSSTVVRQAPQSTLSTDVPESSSPVINRHQHNNNAHSNSSSLSSPSNLDSSVSSSFKSNTTGSETASSGFDQHFGNHNPANDILPALKPLLLPINENISLDITKKSGLSLTFASTSPVSVPFVSCVSQLDNFRFVDHIDKTSFNYYAAVDFVRNSWIEFSRLNTV